MPNLKAVENIEGPYWDYSARSAYINSYRYANANNTAEYLLRGDVEWASRFAAQWQELTDALARCSERYAATKDLEIQWIGWRTSWE